MKADTQTAESPMRRLLLNQIEIMEHMQFKFYKRGAIGWDQIDEAIASTKKVLGDENVKR